MRSEVRESPLHRFKQARYADDRDNAHHVVGEHVQRHFGRDVLHSFHLEVGRTHTCLDGAEHVLDCLAPEWDLAWVVVEPLLNAIEDSVVLPSLNSALLACRAFGFNRALPANARPIIAQRPTIFLIRVVVGEPRTGWALIGILVSMITEIGLVKTADRRSIRRMWL